MAIITVNRGNQEVDKFKIVEKFLPLDRVDKLYLNIAPDINWLMRILRTVFSEVILCPDNGDFRCAAIMDVDGGRLGIFFPWILPKSEADRQKTTTFGALGNVLDSDKLWICQEIHAAFNECSLP